MFPNKKYLGLIKDGWKDIGETKRVDVEYLGEGYTRDIIQVHLFCRTRLRIGKEDGKIFKYCPMCMVKIEN